MTCEAERWSRLVDEIHKVQEIGWEKAVQSGGSVMKDVARCVGECGLPFSDFEKVVASVDPVISSTPHYVTWADGRLRRLLDMSKDKS